MKIDKAIEILEHEFTYRDCFDNTDRYHAIKLAIEALDLVKRCRDTQPIWLPVKLPSETEG